MKKYDIHSLATDTGLRFDLESAFEAGKTNGMVLTGTWLKMLDSENYEILRDMCRITDGSYSLNSLGEAIVKNKKIRMR